MDFPINVARYTAMPLAHSCSNKAPTNGRASLKIGYTVNRDATHLTSKLFKQTVFQLQTSELYARGDVASDPGRLKNRTQITTTTCLTCSGHWAVFVPQKICNIIISQLQQYVKHR